jgi:uncharacterized membrane protein YeaQ/YmgE (transglycosylase-associated protein family)
MNTKNLLIASLIGAVVTTFFANVPVINLLNCLVCLPFWGGPLLAVWFYKHQTGSMNLTHGVYVGLLTGVFAGVFGLLFSFVGMAGASALVNLLRQYMPAEEIPPLLTGGAALAFTFMGVLTNIVFGLIGGLVGGAIFKDKTPAAVAATN